MGARDKLNKASLIGAVALAALLGGLTRSWTVFGIAAAVLVAGAVLGGDIRLKKDRRR